MIKECRFCKAELKKFGPVIGDTNLWFCPDRHYSFEIINQINENNYEYEESIMFGSFALKIFQPYDVWELEYSIKKWVSLDGGEISVRHKVPIEPFPLTSLEEIKEKLETYITFS